MKLAKPELIVEDFKFGVSKPADYAVPVCCSHMYEPLLSVDDSACFYLGIQNQDGTWSLHQKYVRRSDLTRNSLDPLSAVFSRITEAHRLSEDTLYTKMQEAASLGRLVTKAPDTFFFETFARERGWVADETGNFHFAGEALPEFSRFHQGDVDARRARLQISEERLESIEPVFIESAGWRKTLAKLMGKDAKDIEAHDWKIAIREAIATDNTEAFVVLCDMVVPQRIAVSQEQIIRNIQSYAGQLMKGGKFDKLADLAAHLDKGSAYAFVFVEQLAAVAQANEKDFPAYYELLKIADGSPVFLEAFNGKALDEFRSKIWEDYHGRWNERYALEGDLIRICAQSPRLLSELHRWCITGWHDSACQSLNSKDLLDLTDILFTRYYETNDTFFNDHMEVLGRGAAALLSRGETDALARLAENTHIPEEIAHFMRSVAAIDGLSDEESYAIEQQLRRLDGDNHSRSHQPLKVLYAQNPALWSKEDIFSVVEVKPSPRPTPEEIKQSQDECDARNARARQSHGFGMAV
jgi:hypothetical protein